MTRKLLLIASVIGCFSCAQGNDTTNNVFNNNNTNTNNTNNTTTNNTNNTNTTNNTNNCTPECEDGYSRCSGDTLQVCELVENCNAWVDDTDCTLDSGICEETTPGQAAACVIPCTDACTLGHQRCYNNAVDTCVDGGDCTIWQQSDDCTTSSETCEENAGANTATCTAGCVDECSNVGDANCSGNMVQTCVLSGGCMIWSDVTDCTTQGKVCQLSSGTASCITSTFDVFFSEYMEGSSVNKALEIYFRSATNFDTANCSIQLYSNGDSSPSSDFVLDSLTVNTGDVFVFCDDGISISGFTPAATCDMFTSASLWNGNDAISITCNGTVYDVFGQIGTDPGTAWTNGGVSTLNSTLKRKCSVTTGDTNGSDAFDPSLEWESEPSDTYIYLGSHTLCK
ncbi:hypothetical protein KKF34_06290 [Myxococcota bacterium]|nr:hypothetical protein [Myxococcota bacterium]MBU1381772.1 hypothetical protein [Myxococcota bacterium]MBU1496468.1 hypothetical protein [Myxococcota bacterium]